MKGIIVFLAVLGLALAALPTCPPPGEDGLVVHFPNPDDCSTFYKCLGLKPVLMSCPPGLWYNPEYEVCDYPENIPEGICKPPKA